jgi:hypothetical protein
VPSFLPWFSSRVNLRFRDAVFGPEPRSGPAEIYGFSEGVEKAAVADWVREEVRGAAYGLAAFVEGIAKPPASLLLGVLYETGARGSPSAWAAPSRPPRA